MKRNASQTAVGIGVAAALVLVGTAVAYHGGQAIACIPGVPCFGTPLADDIEGTMRSDRIDALSSGDDVLAKRGSDEVIGGDGKDFIEGGTGGDRLYGQDLRDCLFGDEGADFLSGGPGSERIRPWERREGECRVGISYLLGGSGDDRMLGGAGEDDILGEDGDDELVGGAGRDRLDGGPGDDFVNAAAAETRPDRLIHCSTGTDEARIDRNDPRPVGCERVNVVP